MNHKVLSLNYNAQLSLKKRLSVVFVCIILVVITSCDRAIATPFATSTSLATFIPTLDPSWAILDNNWLQLYYPKDWNIQVTNCASESNNCIIYLSEDLPSLSVTTEIGVVMDQSASETSDVVQVYDEEWHRTRENVISIGAIDFLKLVSKEEIIFEPLSGFMSILY